MLLSYADQTKKIEVAEHVARSGHGRKMYKVLFGKIEGKRPTRKTETQMGG
jgi:hypothetical protein